MLRLNSAIGFPSTGLADCWKIRVVVIQQVLADDRDIQVFKGAPGQPGIHGKIRVDRVREAGNIAGVEAGQSAHVPAHEVELHAPPRSQDDWRYT